MVVPIGLVWASNCAFLLIAHTTPLISALIITALSIGFDTTHPLMSSITTSIDPTHRGQITGLTTFANFVGMATGSMAFHRLMMSHFAFARVCFASLEFSVGLLALYAFRAEVAAG